MQTTQLDHALTIGFEMEVSTALGSLPTLDLTWYETLIANASDVDVVTSAAATPTHTVAIEERTSRPRIFAAPSAPAGFREVLQLRAPPALDPDHAGRFRARTELQGEGLARAREWLFALSPAELHQRLSYLITGFAHAGPVIVFVEELTFSNIYEPPNLTGGAVQRGSPRCVLSELLEQPRETWAADRVRLFFSLSMAASVGPTSLIKEINFSQLGYWETRRHLLGRIQYWTAADVDPVAPNINATTSSTELVTMFTAARAKVLARADSAVYRMVNGRTFQKVEHRMQRTPVVGGPRPHYGLIASAAPDERATVAFSVLRQVLSKALDVTNSHYVMSRGVRNYALFNELVEKKDFETLCDWEPDKFFCFVLRRSEAPDGGVILRSISERMKYNTWHFLPDTLRDLGAQAPSKRDYFFAPKSPDLSFHEDHVHAGHVQAKVKFAMRFPMPVTVFNQPLKGLADLRFARQVEPAFTPDDMKSAFPLAAEILEIHQALADFGIAMNPTETDYEGQRVRA